MRISPIQQQNYNTSLNFQGSIDKSFTNYLKMVRKDIIKINSSNKVFNIETIKETSVLINNIMTKLKSFMERTSDDVVLYLPKSRNTDFGGKLGRLRFKNLKTGAEVSASNLRTGRVSPRTDWITDPEITITPMQENLFLLFLGIRGKHNNISELKMINDWTNALTSKAHPAHVDLALTTAMLEYKEKKDFNKALERMHLSEVEKRKLEMKNAIKELKDIEI